MEIYDRVARSSKSQFLIDAPEADDLWDALSRLTDKDFDKFSPDEFIDLALAVPPLFPPELRRQLVEYRRRAPGGDVFLLRGLIPSKIAVPPSASTSSARPSGPVAQNAALLLVGIMTVFGEPFNYRSLWDGQLVQNIIPVRGAEYNQTSQGSRGTLDWHVEDGFRDDRCDYAGLLCLRGDPAVGSMYSQAKDLRLPPGLEATLRDKRFKLRPDTAHVFTGDVAERHIAVLTGPTAEPEICYDTHHISPIDSNDTEASDALRELHACLDDCRGIHVMEKGDVLIFDNRRVVHARGPFVPRFDGTDRWLMRTMVCGSAVTFRRWGKRIPE